MVPCAVTNASVACRMPLARLISSRLGVGYWVMSTYGANAGPELVVAAVVVVVVAVGVAAVPPRRSAARPEVAEPALYV